MRLVHKLMGDQGHVAGMIRVDQNQVFVDRESISPEQQFDGVDHGVMYVTKPLKNPALTLVFR